MTSNEIEELLNLAKESNDQEILDKYYDQYKLFLDESSISVAVGVVIKTVDLDKGRVYLKRFSKLKKDEISKSWKAIRESAEFKNNTDNTSLKLACAFIASALDGDDNALSVLGNAITAFATFKPMDKEGEEIDALNLIIKNFILDWTNSDMQFMDWKSIKVTPDKAIDFCSAIIRFVESVDEETKKPKITNYVRINKWANDGLTYAIEAKELKEREKNKPPKKSDELAALVDHFKMLEDELDKVTNEVAKLSVEKKSLMENLSDARLRERELETKIAKLEDAKVELEKELLSTNKMIGEQKTLIDAQVQYRGDSLNSMLEDIASALQKVYADFPESVNMPMNEMLGEIYREKIKDIFKILEQKGIKVGD